MAVKHVTKKLRPPFRGVDIKADEFSRDHPFCGDGKNGILGTRGEIRTRFGSHILLRGRGLFGSAHYKGVDLIGNYKEEVILFGKEKPATPPSAENYPGRDSLFVLQEKSFTITNNHATQKAYIRHYYDESANFKFKITVGTNIELNYSLGTGRETSPVTLATLRTQVAATSCVMSAPEFDTVAAAFTEMIDDVEIAAAGGSQTFYYFYFREVIPAGFSFNTFQNKRAAVGHDDFYKVSTALINSDLYISSSSAIEKALGTFRNVYSNIRLMKYDGQNFYRAGCPRGYGGTSARFAVPASKTDVKGTFNRTNAVGAGNYLYKTTIINKSKTGLIVEGNIQSDTLSMAGVVAGEAVYLDLHNNYSCDVLDGNNGHGINVKFARVQGAQNVNTITVDGGQNANFAVTFTPATDIVNGILPVAFNTAIVPVYFTTTGTLPTGITASKRYFAVAINMGLNQFRLCETIDGSDAGAFVDFSGAGAGVHTCYYNVHMLDAGDVVYYWDFSQSLFVERLITATTVTTVTLSNTVITDGDSGATPNVADNCVMSVNSRIALWRTKAGITSPYYLVDEIPNHMTLESPITDYLYTHYVDEKTDAQLGAEYIETEYGRDAPPLMPKIAAFNDVLVGYGNQLNANTCYFSDETPEYFPLGTHEFDVSGTELTGAGQSGDAFLVMSRDKTSVVSGELRNLNFRIDVISSSIGCASFDTIQTLEEGVLFFLSEKGPYVCTNGRSLVPLGVSESAQGASSRIEPFFTELYTRTEVQPVYKRATAVLMPKSNLYLIFIPFEDPSNPDRVNSTYSAIWAYDYSRGSYYPKWTGLNGSGGMVCMSDVLYLVERYYNASHGEIDCFLHQQQKGETELSYADHNNYIDFQWKFHWENAGDYHVFKKFLRAKFFSLLSRIASTMRFYVKTYLDYSETTVSTNELITVTTQKEISAKLKADKAFACELVIESQRYYEPVEITGVDIEMATSFDEVFS